jgi:putative tryptophan/tyrosine transport system substrate-binding protein
VQFATLTARDKIPAAYPEREMRWRVDELRKRYRQVGVYAGSILKAKPADLPVLRSTKFELVINLQTRGRSASRCHQACSPSPMR